MVTGRSGANCPFPIPDTMPSSVASMISSYQILSGFTSVYPCASMAMTGTDTAAAKKHTETIAAANR